MERRPIRRQSLLAALLVITILASGCAAPGAPAPAAKAQSAVTRETNPAASQAAVAAAAAGNNAFALDLYRSLAGEGGNIFFSPYSISGALAMVYGGARENTAGEMKKVLHYTLPDTDLHPALNALDQALGKAQSADTFTLKTANSAWAQQGFRFRQDYLDLLARNYGVGVRLADFKDASLREAARQAVNDWAKQSTEGKIPELIGKNLLTEYTRLILANAIYFKADWKDPFPKEKTSNGPFTLAGGEQVQVPMMRSRTGQYLYFKGQGYEAVELPYKGDRMSMLVLLPEKGGLSALEAKLDAGLLQAAVAGLKPEGAQIVMPKFKFETSYLLEKQLPTLGMRDLFDVARANLSGMAEPGEAALFVKHLVHKAIVAVDEKGTEAAAATAAIAEVASMPRQIVLDRAFVFAIRDRETGTVLFVGRVADPRG